MKDFVSDASVLRRRIQEGDTPVFNAWLTFIVDRIEVDAGVLRLFGQKHILEQFLMAGATATPGVRTFVPKWRAVHDKSANSYVIEMTL